MSTFKVLFLSPYKKLARRVQGRHLLRGTDGRGEFSPPCLRSETCSSVWSKWCWRKKSLAKIQTVQRVWKGSRQGRLSSPVWYVWIQGTERIYLRSNSSFQQLWQKPSAMFPVFFSPLLLLCLFHFFFYCSPQALLCAEGKVDVNLEMDFSMKLKMRHPCI